MVGGGYRRDEGSSTVSNSNVFAALDSLRKKKKSDQEKGKVNKSAVKGAGGKSKRGEEEKQVYWAPAPLTVKSWADVDDEDDDDYYATTAPPLAMWAGGSKGEGSRKPDAVEESESEDELLDEGDDDVEEEHDHEPEVEEEPEPTVKKPVEASPAPKETERQLSKKERRKKELAELEAILADFGVNPNEKSEDATKDSKEGESNGDTEKKDNANPVESKSAKKKKKKDKVKEPKDEPNNSSGVSNGQEEIEHVEQDSSAVDVKERLKKLASAKKKKSSKEMDGAARAAAAMEAAARNSRIAAAKKKEKSHYNQQPTR